MFFFLLFSVALILGVFFSLVMKTAMRSVIAMAFSFICASALLVMIGAEFYAMLLLIVYVGAVVTIFIFAVMTMGMDDVVHGKFPRAMFYAFLMPIVFCSILFYGFKVSVVSSSSMGIEVESIDNVHAIGTVMYTEYMVLFQLVGLMLLMATVVVISLLHKNDESDDSVRVNYDARHALLIDVKSRDGVDI